MDEGENGEERERDKKIVEMSKRFFALLADLKLFFQTRSTIGNEKLKKRSNFFLKKKKDK